MALPDRFRKIIVKGDRHVGLSIRGQPRDRDVGQDENAALAATRLSPHSLRSTVSGPDLAADIAARVIQMLGNGAQLRSALPDPPDENLVFVISSFAPEMEPIYLAIAAAARAVGLRAERVKDVKGDYRVTDQILTMIKNARFVVADLTYERPNVYFELGYARGLGKTAITIIRAGNTAHFDVCDWTYLEYFDSRPLEADLIERFKFEVQAGTAPGQIALVPDVR